MNLLLEPGTVLGQRYRLESIIGRGGMGAVYSAVHLQTGRPLAVKLLWDQRGTGLERFRREAQAAACANQENIVEIVDFGVEGTTPYLVMERLYGRTLAEELERSGRLPWPVAAQIMLQICHAMAVVHDKGMIHRDLKPQNCFLLQRQGNPYFVKILDFGIARIESTGSAALTGTGEFLGTLAYMAPEQADAKFADARADIYAAGVILYQMLSGSVPFTDPSPARLFGKIATEPPPRFDRANIPEGVVEILDRALAKRPEDRHQNMRSMAAELLGLSPASLTPVLVTPATDDSTSSTPGRVQAGSSRRLAVVVTSSMSLLAIGGYIVSRSVTSMETRADPVAVDAPEPALGAPPTPIAVDPPPPAPAPTSAVAMSAQVLAGAAEQPVLSVKTHPASPGKVALRSSAERQIQKILANYAEHFSSDEVRLRVEFVAKTGGVGLCQVRGEDDTTTAARHLCGDIQDRVKVLAFVGEFAVERSFKFSR